MTWLDKLFCSRHLARVEELEAENDDLARKLADAERRILTLEKEVITLTGDYAELQDELGDALTELDRLMADVSWYQDRVKALEEILATAIVIPDIADVLEDKPSGVVEPYNHPELGRVDPATHKMVYDLEVGDLQYLTWPKDAWQQLIKRIRLLVKEVHGRPEIPINDCENWAASMATFTAHAFRRASLDMQGALFIAWSLKHAYCGFIDLEGKAWIFDPMLSDFMVGELGSTPEPQYRTRMIWFT